ncbi:hypothetical protein Ahy_B04g072387 isoform A [Arachis hypogaea]|uniref:AP2/ERF domain-containing protein n=1 Tax=Arachis hypogaea TaxID=3818 RepID=A0A444ZN12_ARAHY|nr:hypothetical protein Ahy_B04g072387 isoform A [Arachis hypogaea]
MVSLRRRRLLGLCSGSSSFVAPLPLYCENITATENSTRDARLKTEQPALSDNASMLDSNNIVKEEPGSSNVSGSSSSKDQPSQQISGLTIIRGNLGDPFWLVLATVPNSTNGRSMSHHMIPPVKVTMRPPVKRRKRHRRKNLHNQEPCLMRGVYFKNMKWQAAIKVDKKQIHLGTVGSQQEAAHLYDRAAFMCGREPNFELPEEEKRELRKFKWEEFLALTRQAITRKKHKRRLGSGPSDNVDLPNSNKDDSDNKQGVSSLSACEEDAEQETSLS